MKTRTLSSLVAAALLAVAPAASAEVQVAMNAGRVTIVAKDATVRQILAEWARVGQTRIVNGERIAGGPLTLELRDIPEQQALNILLRAVSGFVLAPRVVATSATASVFDRIIVLPTAVAPAAGPVSAAPPAFAQPTVIPPPLPTVNDDEDDRPANARPVPSNAPQNRGPVFVFPQPQITAPQQQVPQNRPNVVGGVPQQSVQPSTPAPFPGAPTVGAPPAGVSVPGMVVPAPAPPPGQLVPPIPQREQ
jgi:hypothetical protein